MENGDPDGERQRFAGEREDTSAQVIRELVEEELSGEIIEYRIVPDEPDEIIAALIELTDYYQVDLVLTTGGTELAVRDVTPEATKRVIEREVPGIAEAMRATVMQKNRSAMLFRGVCGVRGRTLIVNLRVRPKVCTRIWRRLWISFRRHC